MHAHTFKLCCESYCSSIGNTIGSPPLFRYTIAILDTETLKYEKGPRRFRTFDHLIRGFPGFL